MTFHYLVRAIRANDKRSVVYVPALDVWTVTDDNPADIAAKAKSMIADTVLRRTRFEITIDTSTSPPGTEPEADELFRHTAGMRRWEPRDGDE